MSIIAWIILGLLAGWLAGLLVRGAGYGIVGDIILGILGSTRRRLDHQHFARRGYLGLQSPELAHRRSWRHRDHRHRPSRQRAQRRDLRPTMRDALGAQWPFLSESKLTVQKDLEIQEYKTLRAVMATDPARPEGADT